MSPLESIPAGSTSAPRGWSLALAIGLMVCTLVAVASLLSADQPWWWIFGLAIPWAGYVLMTNTNAAIGCALFLLYSNLVVVAIHFHGVPPLVAIVIPGLLMIPVARHVLIEGQPWLWPRATPWILVFLVVQAMGTVTARDPRAAYEGFKVSVTEGVVLYFLVVNAVRTPAALRWAIWSLLAAGVVMAGCVLHQFATDSYHSNYGGLAQVTSEGFGFESVAGLVGQMRASGPIGVENRFAQILLMLFPLGLFRIWVETQPGTRLCAGFALLVIVSGWAVTFSRGAFVALGLTLLIALLGGHIRWRQLLPLGLFVTCIMLLVPSYRERIFSLTTVPAWLMQRDQEELPDGAVTGRATVMLAAARVYADHPLVGVGPTLFPTYAIEYGNRGGFRELRTDRQAHNLFLSVAAEQGTIGFVAFFGAFAVTLWELQRARRRSLQVRPAFEPVINSFTLVLLIYLTTGLFEHFSFIRYYWVMLALAAAACTAVDDGVLEPGADGQSKLPSPSPSPSAVAASTAGKRPGDATLSDSPRDLRQS